MLDISWTEFLLIGVVALIVIGPKELPAVLRTLGQWTRKVRSMAADFQNQFQEAMREAEMADLKKDIDDITSGIKRFDPLKDVRADVEAAGKDIQSSLEQTPAPVTSATGPAETAAATGSEASVSLPSDPAPPPAAELPIAEAAADLGDANVVGAATGPVTPEAAEKAAGEFPASEAPSYAREKAVVAAAIGPVRRREPRQSPSRTERDTADDDRRRRKGDRRHQGAVDGSLGRAARAAHQGARRLRACRRGLLLLRPTNLQCADLALHLGGRAGEFQIHLYRPARIFRRAAQARDVRRGVHRVPGDRQPDLHVRRPRTV